MMEMAEEQEQMEETKAVVVGETAKETPVEEEQGTIYIADLTPYQKTKNLDLSSFIMFLIFFFRKQCGCRSDSSL